MNTIISSPGGREPVPLIYINDMIILPPHNVYIGDLQTNRTNKKERERTEGGRERGVIYFKELAHMIVEATSLKWVGHTKNSSRSSC
jgi:hypothetical protein